ncbi:MAG: TetR/AcrR family transcriptional regulator [Clostridium sp.]|nr:TetR/AcrR family transcriptional regulator [Clostridium sp.]
MKISKDKRNTNTAKRTISAFSNALLSLLQRNSFEQITIKMLCEESTYPRSTFYNYFEDIYDLAECIMEKLCEEIKLEDFRNIDHKIRSLTLFEMSYDVLSNHSEVIKKIIKKNNYNGLFMQKVRNFMRKTISNIVGNSECIELFQISNEIMKQHYSNTIQLVLEQCFLAIDPIPKEEAVKTLDFLLGTLEREAIGRE